MDDGIIEGNARRRRLLWRASHRGIKEMDLLLGGFARRYVAGMSEQELEEFERIVALPDDELLAWTLGRAPVPEKLKSATLQHLISFKA